MGRKKKNNYFTEETEDKILEYIAEKDERKKNRIYSQYLHTPLRTIAEVFHSKLSVDYIEEDREDAINDCVSYLVTQSIYGFSKGKGKAYSYLSISARNHFIQKNNKMYRQLKKRKFEPIPKDSSEIYIDDSINTKEYNKEFLEKYYAFLEWMPQHLDKIISHNKTKEQVLDILDYMENFESDSYQKKDILQEIYSRYGYRSDNYTVAREKIKSNMYHFFREWDKENFNPEPVNLKLVAHNFDIPNDKKEYIKKHYVRHSHQYGVRALSKKLKLPETVVRAYAVKEGIH